MRTVLIEIHYISLESQTRILQRGSFSIKGRTKEEVALAFWGDIKRESSRTLELEQVLCDGEDITELVKNKQ
ncbi:hypothetical protein V7128_05555 [Neobacillus vireti]|uniref:hypothetical protein n=1 Tax=Neobacillus vireti TaxID=220686 RepID=UPI002FFEB856